jgi:hypothetical protein
MLRLEWGVQHLYLGGKGYQTSYIHMELTPTILCNLHRITRYQELTVHYFSQYLVADEIFRRRKKSLADRDVIQVGGH